jgi:hypothetical protein
MMLLYLYYYYPLIRFAHDVLLPLLLLWGLTKKMARICVEFC